MNASTPKDDWYLNSIARKINPRKAIPPCKKDLHFHWLRFNYENLVKRAHDMKTNRIINCTIYIAMPLPAFPIISRVIRPFQTWPQANIFGSRRLQPRIRISPFTTPSVTVHIGTLWNLSTSASFWYVAGGTWNIGNWLRKNSKQTHPPRVNLSYTFNPKNHPSIYSIVIASILKAANS